MNVTTLVVFLHNISLYYIMYSTVREAQPKAGLQRLCHDGGGLGLLLLRAGCNSLTRPDNVFCFFLMTLTGSISRRCSA